jgi:hypothetical protein
LADSYFSAAIVLKRSTSLWTLATDGAADETDGIKDRASAMAITWIAQIRTRLGPLSMPICNALAILINTKTF